MEEGERETPSCRHEAGLGLGTALRGLLLTFSTPGGKTPVNVDMGYALFIHSRHRKSILRVCQTRLDGAGVRTIQERIGRRRQMGWPQDGAGRARPALTRH